MNTTLSQGFAYDATSVFGFAPLNDEPLPEAAPGEIVIRYGGWSLQELRDTVGMTLMHKQKWYNTYPWSAEKLPPGNYRLRIPVPDSNRKTFAEQQRMLPPGEQVAPVVLVATALLARRLQTGEYLLKTDFTRCREATVFGLRVALDWLEGRLYVGRYWACFRYRRVWLSSVL
jgi:hypothetical protein